MDPVPDLIAAISDEPSDLQSQLVLADHLLAHGDPRGELIALDIRDRTTPGGMTDPEALEHLLLLAAEFTFPCAREVPDLDLAFRGDTEGPVDLVATFEGARYRVRYRRRTLTIDVEHATRPTAAVQLPRRVVDRVAAASAWTEYETERILRVITDAIVHHTPFAELQFPVMSVPLPVYSGGAVRCYRLPMAFTGPRQISPTRYGLAARDRERWYEIWNRQRAGAARLAK